MFAEESDINKLKVICTDKEWEKYRKQILKSSKSYLIQYSLRETDGLYERMLESIKKELFINRLNEYEKVLRKIPGTGKRYLYFILT